MTMTTAILVAIISLSFSLIFTQSSSVATVAYSVEFQILDYVNYEGRLLNGDCCSGYKSALGRGPCRGGNATCNPYWKICLTQQQPVDNETMVMPTQRRAGGSGRRKPTNRKTRSLRRYRFPVSRKNENYWSDFTANKAKTTPKPTTTSSSTTEEPTTTAAVLPTTMGAMLNETGPAKPSVFKSFLNRILHGLNSGLKTVQSLTDYAAGGESIKSSSSQTTSCSIAFWTTEAQQNGGDGTLTLRASIPRSVMNRYRHSVSRDSGSGVNRETVPEQAVTQKVLVFVEIWHKHSEQRTDHPGSDKLIARHLEHKVTTVQLPGPRDTFWEYGGPSVANNNTAVDFKYRWRLMGEYETTETPEVTTGVPCPEGYEGAECKEPICSSGCDGNHGYCETPGECKCRFGWTGEYCSLCIPMPGCVHGSCIKPFECRCEEGWSGMFCDKPTCKVGCHPQNGYCEHPFECRCRFGYKGDNCTDCSTMPGCQNGGCEQPLDCNCLTGWKGLFCSIPMCSEGCDIDHGWCRRPDECRCKVGWTGSNCTQCVPYPGCEHGSCNDPWTCNCQPSWGGVTCSEKLDYCQLNESPCQNGATCISVEKVDGSYLCQCPLGYEGRHCDRLKN
ncbi:Delta-like protein 1 [Halotydeus destructor]|nr:Delta-like protein 1 [Halotydeus destructor]